MNKSKLILALGSNSNQEKNIENAIIMLQKLFDDNIRITRKVWTEPIGIKSDKFLNCLVSANTSFEFENIQRALKNIEVLCGDKKENRKQNIIRIDIDILQFGDKKFHDRDWTRKYIKELVKELN